MRYAIKAAGDAEFQRFAKNLDELLVQMRDAAKTEYNVVLSIFQTMFKELKQLQIEDYAMTQFGKDGLTFVDAKLCEGQRAAGTNTYFGYRETIELLSLSNKYRTEAIKLFKDAALTDLQQRIRASNDAIAVAKRKRGKERPVFALTFGIAFAIIEILALISAWSEASNKSSSPVDRLIRFVFWTIAGTILSLLVAGGIAVIVSIIGAPIIGIQNMRLGSQIASGEQTVAELQSLGGKIDALR